jgi:hypothetical protein
MACSIPTRYELLVVEECPLKDGPKFFNEPVIFPAYRLAFVEIIG